MTNFTEDDNCYSLGCRADGYVEPLYPDSPVIFYFHLLNEESSCL